MGSTSALWASVVPIKALLKFIDEFMACVFFICDIPYPPYTNLSRGSCITFIDTEGGREYLESCSEHPELIQDIESTISKGFELCVVYQVISDYQNIDRIAPTIISLIEAQQLQAEFGDSAYNRYSFILGSWGMAKAGLGQFDKGKKLLEKGISFAEEINHCASVGIVESDYGIFFNIKGDGHSAMKVLKKAIKDFEKSQTMAMLGLTWASLGYAHWLMEDYRSALDFIKKGLKIHTDIGLPFLLSYIHWCCSLAYFGLDNLVEAKIHAEQALQCSLSNNEKAFQGMSRTLLGRVLAKTDIGQIEAAEGQIRQGINVLEEQGILPFLSMGYLWLGEIYAESGRNEDAMVNMKKSETMFREMGMGYWLGKAQEALAKLR